MKIFNSKTIVGLFDSDVDVENATKALQAQGIDKDEDTDIEIYDSRRLAQEKEVMTTKGTLAAPSSAGAGRTAVAVSKPDDSSSEKGQIELKMIDVLTGHGLDDSEAEFFARRVAHGSKLILVDTTKEMAPHVQAAWQDIEFARTATS